MDENVSPKCIEPPLGVLIDQGIQTEGIWRPTEALTVTASTERPTSVNGLKPRSITLLCTALVFIWCISLNTGVLFTNRDAAAIFSVLFIFLIFATLHFPAGPLCRPHPAFWALVKGISLLYLLLVCWLLFHSVEEVRGYLNRLDNRLAKKIVTEADYAASCSLLFNPDAKGNWLTSLKLTVQPKLDVFVAAHFLGWLVKALVVRDAKILWLMSVSFEMAELTFRHALPNFRECWWDHLFLDIFGCNALGIWCGLKMCKLLELYNYRWTWTPTTVVPSAPAHFFSQFVPYQWTVYHWPDPFSSSQAFCGLIFFVLGVTFLDLNLFFLKAQLWLETTSWPLQIRTILFLFVAAAGTRDLYDFVSHPHPYRRLGMQAWIGLAIIATELLLAIKWWPALPPHGPTPVSIYMTWVFVTLLAVLVALGLRYSPRKRE